MSYPYDTRRQKFLNKKTKMQEQDIQQFFNAHKDILFLPVEIESGDAVYNSLFSRWSKYIELLKSTPELSDCVSEAEFQTEQLKICIESYYSGDFVVADEAVKSVLDNIIKHNDSHIITNLTDLYIDSESHQWFRARQGNISKNFQRKDMKHVPYTLREKVSNTRYSISGIPCLYLGNSIYACYRETKKPTDDQMWVSRYVPLQPIRLLNLSTTAFELVNATTFIKGFTNNSFTEEKYDNFIKEFFVNWILQSACSVHVNRTSTPSFNEEYIIPQRLMIMLKNYNLDGIMYFTVQDKRSYISPLSWISKNIAIPALDSISDSYSKKIDRMFILSNPLNIAEFKNNRAGTGKVCSPPNPNLGRTNEPVIINEKGTCYSHTQYYRAEIELMQPEYWEEAERETIQKIFPLEYKDTGV